MGLRAFHAVFIAVSAALCVWLVGWGWAHRADAQGAALAGLGAAGFAGLAFYLRAFLRQGRGPKLALVVAAVLSLVSEASACPSCVGTTEGDTARAFQAGILFLAVLVLATLGGITVMMTRAIREQELRRQAEG
ncbi:MAG: hypothetical protein HY554_06130 [Elusimicrobia bacterium]|nr:hypothetical protein [Elusimicrobiota bacterium]